MLKCDECLTNNSDKKNRVNVEYARKNVNIFSNVLPVLGFFLEHFIQIILSEN